MKTFILLALGYITTKSKEFVYKCTGRWYDVYDAVFL